ncbi:MAG: hypothetical protein IPP63_16125 [Chloracidobacterium sp.]|nr:hypothetical protein [Chloracidobacterium sp.]
MVALSIACNGATTTNNLTVSNNVTNNGTLDFSTNGDTSGAILTFGAGVNDVVFNGTGATTDVRAIAIAKAHATVVELSPTNFTVQGANTDTAGFLTITSGTFKISGSFAATNRVFTAGVFNSYVRWILDQQSEFHGRRSKRITDNNRIAENIKRYVKRRYRRGQFDGVCNGQYDHRRRRGG